MDSSENRPHRTTNTSSSDLFICFASRFSSSSSMKSVLSPARSDKFRDPSSSSAPLSLPSSLSRRLRSNGSIKGGQASPMFSAGGKKRGCAFENPEPSSPKVTCIGQVRVKSKKKHKQRQCQTLVQRSRSMRKAGDASFRKADSHGGGQKWVHLPVTICEALREFSCFLPCRTESKSTTGKSRSDSCGGALMKWLVTLQEKEGEKGRQIEVVIGEDRMEEIGLSKRRRGRIGEIWDCGKEEIVEEGSDMSICVPPKNALMLMRCGSDPLKMSALANRLWESSILRDGDGSEKEDCETGGEKGTLVSEDANIMKEDFENELNPERNLEISEIRDEIVGMEEQQQEQEAEYSPLKQIQEPMAPDHDPKTLDNVEGESMLVFKAGDGEKEGEFELSCEEINSIADVYIHSEDPEEQCEEQTADAEKEQIKHSEDLIPKTLNQIINRDEEKREIVEKEGIAESLLLQMMFEPKLSMEVSKETWVCGGDFIRRRRRLQTVNPIKGPDEPKKKSTDSRPPVPARWSCSLPFTETPLSRARASVSNSMTVIGGEKVVPYEHMELTRCKSEPVRSSGSGKVATAGEVW